MKKILLVLFTAFVMSGSFSCPDKLNAQEDAEHRGMWVQGFYMNYPGGTVDADDVIDKARSANLNVLYVGSYGSGQGIYESQYVTPWPEDEHWCDTPLYFDVLQYFIEETEGDFDIIPWLCIGLMPNYMEDQVCNPMRSNLDWRMVDAANYHYSWLDYANPEAIEWLLAVIDELARNYDIKGIHLDYIRNPRDCNTYVSVSKDALRRYEKKYRSDIDTQIILPHDVLLPTFGKYLAYHPITNPTTATIYGWFDGPRNFKCPSIMLNQYGINGGEVLLFNWDPYCASEWRGGDFHKIFKNFVFGWWGINNRWPPEIYVIGDPEWPSIEALKKTLEWMNTKYTILNPNSEFIIPNEAKIVLYRPWEPMEDNIIEAVAHWVGNRGGKLMLLGRGVGYRFKDEYESPLLKRLIGAEDHIDGLYWNVCAHNPHKVNKHPWIERRSVSSSRRPLSYRYALKVSNNWMELNAELIDELVSQVRAVLYRYPSIHRRYLSVAGIPEFETARAANQNWPGWIDKGIVDYVNPMSYSQDIGVFKQWCERYKESGYMTAKTVFPGIGAHQLDEQGVEEQITTARDYGSFGQVLFFNRRDIPWEIMIHLGQTVYNTVVPPAYPIRIRRDEKSFSGRDTGRNVDVQKASG